ncbi:ribbon-helix-helix domain-containing protein [Novosphingobium decolorationis]|uniref:Ribbon-helix-helix protein, CopG family n=1 Tax=Novosphingobium decolorationis TaxID=2698673 RepID=A0ABX8E6V7_9SPHN|nr:ribbon-helix-helix domain-containing protein [Novosphingobium decolorationis]QVM84538.1 ribbon-helix-helix protein, CopG family [Novosphingobium decolorationis]
MAQVNVSYDDGLLRRLDALAERQNVSRPDLFRALAEEAVRADEQGRAMFDPPEQPVRPDDAVRLVQELSALRIDLDRLLRSAEKRERNLLMASHATEEANRNARETHAKELAGRFREGSSPFFQALQELQGQITSKLDEVTSAVERPSGQAAIEAHLVSLRKEVLAGLQQKRPSLHWHFFDQFKLASWETAFLLVVGLIALSIVQVGAAKVLPYSWIATPVASALYGSSDIGICELYRSSRRLDQCPVLAPIKTGGQP